MYQLFSEQLDVPEKPKLRGGKVVRQPLPAQIRHQVQLRDRGQCSYKQKDGSRCGSRRFLEIHHVKPVSQGGSDTLENLRLLCHGHHKVAHLSDIP